MAPFSLMAASVSLVAKSFSVFSCSSLAARCVRVLPAAYTCQVKCLTSQTFGPPKRPMNGYMRYVMQQQPGMMKQNPDTRVVEIVRRIAKQWRTMSPEQKQPFEEAFRREREQFKVDLQRYQDQLTPAQLQQEAQAKKERTAKRKAIRKKRELTNLGKPKRPRSSFNVYMSEHFKEARGVTTQAKMMSLLEDWNNLFSHQKKSYQQLAEDDKIRYKNEMKLWEDNMVNIGREDLIRDQTLSAKKKAATKLLSKKVTKATVGKKKAVKKMTTNSPAKTARSTKTTKATKATKKTKTTKDMFTY